MVLMSRWFDVFPENCPDHDPSLSSWKPGHQPEKAFVLRSGHRLRLEESATVHSITIQSGGKDFDDLKSLVYL